MASAFFDQIANRDVAKRMVLSLRDNPLGSFLGPLSRLCAGRLPPHEDVTILNFDLDPLAVAQPGRFGDLGGDSDREVFPPPADNDPAIAVLPWGIS
jgi:hypothetical protein